MSDQKIAPSSSRPRGRRARRLTDAEQQAGRPDATPQAGTLPRPRGPVAPPSADAPMPTLRRYGRRARVIELVEQPPLENATVVAGTTPSAEGRTPALPAQDSQATGGQDLITSPESVSAEPRTWNADSFADKSGGEAGKSLGARGATSDHQESTVVRDDDGVELGEVSQDAAPAPRPAPRFEGRVLNRREQGGGRAFLWVLWVVLALVIIALVVLLATGTLGGLGAAASAGLAVAVPGSIAAPVSDAFAPYSSPDREEPTA